MKEIRLFELITKDSILLEESCNSKIQTINHLVDLLCQKCGIKNRNAVLNAIIRREEAGSTAIGRGVAVPHARTNAVESVSAAFAKINKGADFNALDGKPVYFIFLLISPKTDGGMYLRILASISKLLKKTSVREKLFNAKTPEEVIDAFKTV